MRTSLHPRVAACAACLLLALSATAQGQSSKTPRDLSIECPPTAAGGKQASSRTPLSSRSEARSLHKDMAACTSKRDRTARAECAREVWEGRSAAAGTEPTNQRMAMAECR